jgi:DNA-binding transcriptional LysR family regulator
MIPNLTTEGVLLGDLRLFVAAARLAGLAAAGRSLGIPRASASRQLQRLERALGCRLIHRQTRRFALTEEGLAFLPMVLRALGDIDEAVEAVGGKPGELKGTLRIAAPYTYGRTVLSPIVADFAGLHPGLAVSVELSSRRVDLFGNEADLAIRIGATGSDELVARRLDRDVFVLVAAADYLATAPDLATVADLARHRMLDASTGPHDLELVDGDQRELVRIIPCLSSNEPSVLIDAARKGLGIALVPGAFAVEAIEAGRVTRVLPRWSTAAFDINAVYVPGRGQSRKIRAFLDYAVPRLASRRSGHIARPVAGSSPVP